MNKFSEKKPSSTAPTVETVSNDVVQSDNSTTNVSHKTKKRNWAFIIYPESLPADWHDILVKSGLPLAISPLHDKDVNPDGTKKKAHYHVIAVYGSPTTFSNVKNLTDRLNAPIPIALDQVRGMYRYFSHKDNPEKAQYDEKDIQHLNGFSILDFCEMTKNEVLQVKKKLVEIIKANQFSEYSTFIDYVMLNYTDTEFDVASNNTFFFDKYLSSRRHASADSAEKKTSSDTVSLADTALTEE